MQDKLMWFPKVRAIAGASVLALGMVAALNAPAFAKSVVLNSGKSVSMAASQPPGGATLVNAIAANDTVMEDATGVVIISTDAEGPAAQAGIVRGDILLMMGDVAIDSAAGLYELVKVATPGDDVMLSVQHGDDVRTIAVTLGTVTSDQLGERAYLGVQVADPVGSAVAQVVAIPALDAPPVSAQEIVTATIVTATEAISGEIMTMAPGLIVAEIMADGPAAQVGLAAGDLIVAIDRQPVASPDDFINALKGHTPGEVAILTVQKGGPMGAVISEFSVTLGAAPDDPSRAYLGIRIVSGVPSVSVELAPSGGAFTAPAIPVPAMPALPEMTPGYSYPDAYAGGACAPPTIQQYFYPPANVMPFAPPISPRVPMQPIAPAAPFYIYHAGENNEVYAYAVTGQTVTGQTVSGQTMSAQAVPTQVEKNVILWQVQPAMPGVEMQRFEIQLQSGALPMVPTQQSGFEVPVWVSGQMQGGDGSQSIEKDVTVQKVIVKDGGVQKDFIFMQPLEQTQMMWSVPTGTMTLGAVQGDSAAIAPGMVRSFTVQMTPDGEVMRAMPFDPAAGVAVPQSIVPAVPATEMDAWY